MKLKLLPSTFDAGGALSERQHFACFVINGCVAIDAGSLAHATSGSEKAAIRDVVLTHAHLDHIAGLPLFIDDLFPTLTEPVRVHATREVIDVLETHIFNWAVYPRFSELKNWYGDVIAYSEIENGKEFELSGLRICPVAVNHKVPTCGFIIGDSDSTIAITGDTAEMDEFWNAINSTPQLSALVIECAFPNEFDELSSISHHLTPKKLSAELRKSRHSDCPIFVINIKPTYREAVVGQLMELGIANLEILEVGKEYRF